MLQWMGGSRRKVNTSRKSTHNRQKQYFEQKKRQLQIPGPENWVDARNKHAHSQEEPRSLDILSLINLASVAPQGYPSHSSEVDVPHVTSHVSKPSPPVVSKKIISKYTNDLEEASTCPQHVPSAHMSSGKLDGSEISAPPIEFASSKTGLSPNEQEEETQNYASVLDLLNDECPGSVSEGKLVPEAHVAFSVEGLGKIGAETPGQSPNPNDRISHRSSPTLTKASKGTHSSVKLKSILYDLGLELDGKMNDVRMSDDGIPSKMLSNSRSLFDDVGNMKSTRFMESSMHLDDYDNVISGFDADEESFCTYMEDRKDQQWNELLARVGILNDSLLDGRKYDPALKNKAFYTDCYPSSCSKPKNSGYDFGFQDPDSLDSRIARNPNRRFDMSAPSTASFRHLTSDKELNSVSFDCERYPTPNNGVNFGAMFDPCAWSLLADEDAEDSMSLLSEESCSSMAVWQERSSDFGPCSPKLRQNKINLTDRHNLISEHKGDLGKLATGGTFYTREAIQKKNLMGTRNCRTIHKKRNCKAGHCSKEYSACQGTLEPKFISLFDEEYASVKAASTPGSCYRNSTQADGRSFNCKLLSEDNLFDMFPVPKLSPSWRSKSNIPVDYEPSDNSICEDEILRQTSNSDARLHKPATHPLEREVHFPNSSCAAEFLKCTQFPDLSWGQNVSKEKEDASRRSLEKPRYDSSVEKRSLSSVNSVPALDADYKEDFIERKVLKDEIQESVDSPNTRNPPEEAKETPMVMEEVSTQLESCVNNRPDQSAGGSPIPDQAGKKDLRKEKSGADIQHFGSKGGSSSATTYQVMLESYVLQLLCVQKVLMEASEKDIGKKVLQVVLNHKCPNSAKILN